MTSRGQNITDHTGQQLQMDLATQCLSVCEVCMCVVQTHQSGERRRRLSQYLAPHADQAVPLAGPTLSPSCSSSYSSTTASSSLGSRRERRGRGLQPGQLAHASMQAAGQRQQLLTCRGGGFSLGGTANESRVWWDAGGATCHGQAAAAAPALVLAQLTL